MLFRSSIESDRIGSQEFDFEAKSEFEHFLKSLVPLQIPVAYLESMKAVEESSKTIWRKTPGTILSGPAMYGDEALKVGVATATALGSRLVLLQHGGFYGTSEYSFSEAHEVAVSDRYLTWGWTDPGIPKIQPLGITKPSFGKSSRSGRLLLVLSSSPRYSYAANSDAVSTQVLDSFRLVESFLLSLDDQARRSASIRGYGRDYGWGEIEHFRQNFPEVSVSRPRSRIAKDVSRARLTVTTSNTTTFLECVSSNVPCLLLSDRTHLEVRPASAEFFSDLVDVGVVHLDAQTAADHVGRIWDEVEDWWSRREVQDAVGRFAANFALRPARGVTGVRSALVEKWSHPTRDEIGS